MRSGHGSAVPGLPVAGAAPAGVSFAPTIVSWPGVTVTSSAGYYVKLPGLCHMWLTFTVSISATAQLTCSLPPGVVGLVPAGFSQLECGSAWVASGVVAATAPFAGPTQMGVLSITPGVGNTYVYLTFPTAN